MTSSTKNNKPNPAAMFTVTEVAKALRVSRTAVLNWITSGKLEASQSGHGGRYRISGQAILDRWGSDALLACQMEVGE